MYIIYIINRDRYNKQAVYTIICLFILRIFQIESVLIREYI